MIISILYLIIILFIIYDVFGNFFKVYIKTYMDIRKCKGDLKDKNYIKYILYSRFYPLFIGLKQRKVIYPIILFILPYFFVSFFGQERISFINLLIEKHLVLFILPLVLIAYFQNRKNI